VVAASLYKGNLWEHIKFLHLRQNMCLGHSEADNQYAQWLLEIGAGSTMDNNEIIQVSQSMVCVRVTGAQDSRRILSYITVCGYNTTHLQENPQRLG